MIAVLLYGLEQGPIERQVIEQAVRARMPIPAKFRDAPEIFAGNDLFYAAFMDMTSCRDLGFGQIGPITWLTVQRYCEVYGLEGEQREDMFYHIAKMDRAYLDYIEAHRSEK